jgi:hypothetical protein
MPRKVPVADVMRARADNYEHHFECYQIAKLYDDMLRQKYIDLCRYVAPVGINIFGATDRKKDEWDLVIDLANRYHLDCWFINIYYLSAVGWESFQVAWKELPELVHIPCVQVEPLVPVIHTRRLQTYTRG